MEKDIVERLRQYASAVAEGSAVMCVAPMALLEEAAREIEFLRSTVGVVSQGPSFDEIKKSL